MITCLLMMETFILKSLMLEIVIYIYLFIGLNNKKINDLKISEI